MLKHKNKEVNKYAGITLRTITGGQFGRVISPMGRTVIGKK